MYPVATLWSTTYHENVLTVDPNAAEVNGARPKRTEVQQKSHVFEANFQNQLLSKYNQKSKLKLQEWSKLTANKKTLMTIIFGQCNDATRTEIALGANYNTDCENGEFNNFLTRLQTVCYGSDDRG